VATGTDRLLVWGAGGHGKVVADLIRACGCELVGFIDGDAAKLGQVVEPAGGRVIAGQDQLRDRLEAGCELPGGATAIVSAIGNNTLRLATLQASGTRVSRALLHPSAMTSESVEFGSGTVVFAGAVVNAAVQVGCGVIVNSAAVVEHDCVIEDGVHISPGAILAGGVIVGARSWIGAGAVVIGECRIGSDVTVGAGAVVLRDVPDGDTVVGSPARSIRRAGA
jgi:sugar O-acyltransferase (sialic acid O-acetyltransferase NeuD family)